MVAAGLHLRDRVHPINARTSNCMVKRFTSSTAVARIESVRASLERRCFQSDPPRPNFKMAARSGKWCRITSRSNRLRAAGTSLACASAAPVQRGPLFSMRGLAPCSRLIARLYGQNYCIKQKRSESSGGRLKLC